MKIGMLWFDDDPRRDLPAKVQRAADYYQGKYGREPTVCQVSMSEGTAQQGVGKISIRESALVLPSHYWLGIEEA